MATLQPVLAAGGFFEVMPMIGYETQKALILKHIKTRGSITTLIATDKYRCFRLSERIRELERDGFLIHHVRVEKYGRRYMAYSLVEGKQVRAA